MYDFEKYRSSESEKARAADWLRLLPKNRQSILDVGARDGFYARLFTEYFPRVTALDLEKPAFDIPSVTPVAGDATALAYPDNAFDCVFCAEVLEHVPDVGRACRELARVARHEILIGVPYRQDTRVGRTTCRSCGRTNPPYGHVNEFDEARLAELFPGLTVAARSLVGQQRDRTSELAAWLMERGGHPQGTYGQEEPCVHCGARLSPPGPRPAAARLASALAGRLDRVQRPFVRPWPSWIHLVFIKNS